MHETSLVQSLLEQLARLLQKHGAERIETVCVGIGEFSGVEPELFQSAFEMLVEHSPVRGAELRVRRVPLEAQCRQCRAEFPIERFRFVCPFCGELDLKIVRGEELMLEQVILQTANPESVL